MTHKTTITDNYILITSDEEIKDGEWYVNIEKKYLYLSDFEFGEKINPNQVKANKKIIAHLPLGKSNPLYKAPFPLLPPLPSGEDDVEKLADEWYKNASLLSNLQADYYLFIEGYNKAKEKYRFSEEDMVQAFAYGRTLEPFDSFEDFIQSLSQPEMPIGFKCEMRDYITPFSSILYTSPLISDGIMQGEWIY